MIFNKKSVLSNPRNINITPHSPTPESKHSLKWLEISIKKLLDQGKRGGHYNCTEETNLSNQRLYNLFQCTNKGINEIAKSIFWLLKCALVRNFTFPSFTFYTLVYFLYILLNLLFILLILQRLLLTLSFCRSLHKALIQTNLKNSLLRVLAKIMRILGESCLYR